MRTLILAVLMVLIGCVHATEKPAHWNGTALSGYGGVYSNTGKISNDSIKRGYNLRKLSGFFWPGSNLQADEIIIEDLIVEVYVTARQGGVVVYTGHFPLTNGTLILERSGMQEGLYKTMDKFTKTKDGLIIESRTWSAGIFIIPITGTDNAWYFFPNK